MDAYKRNEAAKIMKGAKQKKKNTEDNDKFTDIKGDWY